MADTIISNLPNTSDTGNGLMMNVIVAIIFAAVVIGAVMMYQNGVFKVDSKEPDTTNINVTVPKPDLEPTPVPAPSN
jgi:hypothetical protein